ncbi:STAS domain-containing protein [Rhodovulum tesquicola]|uniref:STAS domain-containing protein n=1 Tax=Rhodovulum tesquicola TaxID=540254 RepID=UPI002096F566|nr:STAS domain-containing protein [Rhodovulum tesquicola]MCO8144326.1 STAS domain-containing protein [Rhodovulum tesquicola]
MSSELIGDLSGVDLARADKIAPRLSAGIVAGGDHHIDTSDWIHCDLTGIATLLSALATATQRGAALAVTMPSGGLVAQRMQACGIDPDRHLQMEGGRATGLAPKRTKEADA